MNKDVEKFLKSSNQWSDEMVALRRILLRSNLDEEFKWRLPCYSYEGANIAIIQPFKSCLALMFFKGMQLKDKKKLLVENGPNSRSAKRLEFRCVGDITKMASPIQAYLKEAVALERSPLPSKANKRRKKTEPLPHELKAALAKNRELKQAFETLTQGRQRAYILFFTGAKQVATREARIAKMTPKILKGEGLHD